VFLVKKKKEKKKKEENVIASRSRYDGSLNSFLRLIGCVIDSFLKPAPLPSHPNSQNLKNVVSIATIRSQVRC